MAIVGNLYKLEKYFTQKELMPLFKYLKNALNRQSDLYQYLSMLPEDTFEKHSLSHGIIAFLQVAYTKNISECFIESHKKYVDFQLLISGIEKMGYIDIDKLQVDAPYCEDKDLITYHMQDNFSTFLLEPQDMAIFFPEDGHIGLAMHKDKCLIRKIVIKVPLSFFEGLS